MSARRNIAALASAAVGLGGLAVVATPTPAVANPSGTGLVISEVYAGGGNSGARYTHDFVELYNPTGSAISLGTYSLQYRAQNNTGTAANISSLSAAGSVQPGQYFVVRLASQSTSVGAAVPNVDFDGGTSINLSGSNGQVFLADVTTGVDADGAGDTTVTDPDVVDFVGYGAPAVKEGGAAAPAPSPSATASIARAATPLDTDVNGTDFTNQTTPTPGEPTGGGTTEPPADPVDATIAEIQGTGDTSPLDGDPVITEGVVTASYPTGGLDGFFLQTPGPDATDGASDGVFVYAPGVSEADYPAVGDSVEVEGDVDEYFGLTQVSADTVTDVADLGDVVPNDVVPGSDCALGACDTGADLDEAREEVEGEAFDLDGDFTVTDNYDGSPYFEEQTSNSSGMFGEIGLAAESAEPLVTPTEVVNVGADATEEEQQDLVDLQAYNEAHRVVLDDGSSTNYVNETDRPFPWFTEDHTVRVDAAVTFEEPVVLGWSFGNWKLEPSQQVVGEPEGITIEQTRAEEAAPQDVGGDLELATFNVLNFFPTTGVEYVDSGLGQCTYYTDRDGDLVTTRSCGSPSTSSGNGPRGAADEENLQRQRDKIVSAINTLDADVVSLEELENSVKLGKDRDFAIGELVEALNADAGAGTWDYAPSPAPEDLPAVDEQDVIRTGFIFKPASVDLVGGSTVLTDDPDFTDAREPVAQAFKADGSSDADAFVVIANHFKSKGSGEDDGTGQGNANPDRVRQAQSLVEFADTVAADAGVEKVFLTGDFNAYTREDPVNVLVDAGYTNLESDTEGEESYSFDGQIGSLDHVFANEAAVGDVTGVDLWTINAYESVYHEYSRYNYNVTDLYDTSPFRSSDHNPEIIGIDVPGDDPVTAELRVSVRPSPVKAGKRATMKVTVRADGAKPTGRVTVDVPGRGQLMARLVGGKAVLKLPPFAKPGVKVLTVAYAGDDRVEPVSTRVRVRVVRR